MYTLNHTSTDNKNYLKLSNLKHTFFAKICLNSGGSLQELILKNQLIIKEFEEHSKEKLFASSILFPFQGRIKNGKYNYKEKAFTLKCNQEKGNIALHGFVYNKEFTLLHFETTDDFIKVTLVYKEQNSTQGFPYKYSVYLTYIFTETDVDLQVKIINNDTKSFPFIIGWHPYFYSSNMHDSHLCFESNQKVIFDKEMLPIKIENTNTNLGFQIKDKKYDDCFILKENNIVFKTPNYNLKINSSTEESYLQIYTPKDKNDCIAIEPMTAPPNSLNSKVGLKHLASGENYNVNWKILFIETNHLSN